MLFSFLGVNEINDAINLFGFFLFFFLAFLGIKHFMFTELSCRKCRTCQFETHGLLSQEHTINAFQKLKITPSSSEL